MKIYSIVVVGNKENLTYNVTGLLDVNIEGVGEVTMEFQGDINCMNDNDKQDFQFEFSFSNSYFSDYVDKIQRFARDRDKQAELYGLVKEHIIEEEL